MRKLLLTAIALSLAAPALAAQQDIAQLSAVTASREALRTAINTQLSAVQANFDEVYAVIDAGPVYVNASAPADTKVVWIDTDQDNAIKVRIGEVWTVVGTAGEAYTLPTAAADTLGGVKVGDRLTITDGVLSADVQTGDGDDQTAAEVGFTPNGSIEATDTQAAVQEVRSEAEMRTPSTLNLTTDTSVTAQQLLDNKYISNQGASGEVDITLPAVSYSITRTVLVTEEQIAEINPPSGEAFDLSGTALDADDCIDSPATVGAKAVFTRMQDSSGTWFWSVDTVRGDWVDTGASD